MAKLRRLLLGLRPKKYRRKPVLVLINGLAEQPETWFKNLRYWDRYFSVHTPNIMPYEGDAFQQRIKNGEPITMDFLVNQLHTYVTQFIQTPPYHIVASSLGGKIAVEFAARYPELVGRLILLCPSGMGDVEQLPIMEGVKGNDPYAIVRSVFYRPEIAEANLLRYYQRVFQSRKWKMGLIKTVKGTNDVVVRNRLKDLKAPTLLVCCEFDKIVNPHEGMEAAKELPIGWGLMIPKCGHAPMIEKSWWINRIVVKFLLSTKPANPKLSRLKLLLKKPRATRVQST
jgi:pimeloyl-ACP methyl ester carboxylesterase